MVAICSILLAGMPEGIFAQEKEAGATASLSAAQIKQSLAMDERVEKLRSYLETKNSPLTEFADEFVAEADRLGLDWRLVPAIAGIESYFGRLIPANSYNAWGWAIFTGQRDGRHFEGWEDGIATVSEGLKYKYVDRGLDTVEKIGPVYAADPHWSYKVNHFIEDIDSFKPQKTEHLAFEL